MFMHFGKVFPRVGIPLPHKIYDVDTRVCNKWRLVSRGGGGGGGRCPIKSLCLVDYIVKKVVILDKKS